MQEQLLSAGEVNDGKQLKILQKVIKNLEVLSTTCVANNIH